MSGAAWRIPRKPPIWRCNVCTESPASIADRARFRDEFFHLPAAADRRGDPPGEDAIITEACRQRGIRILVEARVATSTRASGGGWGGSGVGGLSGGVGSPGSGVGRGG